MKKLALTIFTCLALSFTASAQTGSSAVDSSKNSVSKTKRRGVFRATKGQITQIQTMFKKNNSYGGEITGKFNDDFRVAIKGFQVKNELKKTGTLNRATLEKLGIPLTDKQKTYPINPGSYDTSKNNEPDKPRKKRSKTFRATKKQITASQTKLKDDDKFAGNISGRYSKEFRTSLKDYQKANELKRTGRLDRATIVRMGIPLTKKQRGVSGSAKSRRRSFRVNKDQISQAQTLLTEKKLFNGEVSGKYSKDFRKAIKTFQSANGLKRKGSLNRATLEKMGIELTDKQKEIPVNPRDFAKPGNKKSGKRRKAVFRATKAQIVEVQEILTKKGLYKGEATGKLNPATRAAIREWQAENSVKKTGTLNKVTLEAMKIMLTDRQKAY